MDLDEFAEELGWGREPARYFPETREAQTIATVDERDERRANLLGAAKRGLGGTFLAVTIAACLLIGVTCQLAEEDAAGLTLSSIAAILAAAWLVLGAIVLVLHKLLNRVRARTGYPVAPDMVGVFRYAHHMYLGIGDLMDEEADQIPAWRLDQRRENTKADQHRRNIWRGLLNHLDTAERARLRGNKNAWLKHHHKALKAAMKFIPNEDETSGLPLKSWRVSRPLPVGQR